MLPLRRLLLAGPASAVDGVDGVDGVDRVEGVEGVDGVEGDGMSDLREAMHGLSTLDDGTVFPGAGTRGAGGVHAGGAGAIVM